MEEKHYTWYQTIAGIFYHWEKKVLEGKVVFHIIGTTKEINSKGQFWGFIQLSNNYDENCESMFKTECDSLEKCKEHLDAHWAMIIEGECYKVGASP